MNLQKITVLNTNAQSIWGKRGELRALAENMNLDIILYCRLGERTVANAVLITDIF